MPPYNPTASYGAFRAVRPRKKARGGRAPRGFDPYTGTTMAGSSWNDPVLQDPNYNTFTVDWADPADYGGTTDWGAMGASLANTEWAGGAGAGGDGRSIQINGAPDYRGILDKYSADMRARINTGLANMNATRLGNARSLVNRLGIRDPQAALGKFGKYGITLADLQQAAANPFSELKAIEQGAARQRGQGEAGFAARGGFRSGGTSRMLERVEDERARNEALASEEALRGLAQGESEMAGWQQQQEDMLAGRLADYELQLAQAYQPTTAYWDDTQGGYRWGNKVYDQYGNLIRSL